ncbi:MAG: VWA domain-containing protein [Dehalococcoidia bacterium]
MKRWLAVAAALTIFVVSVAGADGAASGVEIEHIDTSAYPTVTINAPVLDEAGSPVSGLAAENFTITQNGQAVAVDSVEAAIDSDVGAGVVVVIDVSGSMEGEAMEAAKAAASEFVSGLSAADLVAIVTFSDTVQLVQTFTTDKAAASAVIENLEPSGDTALYEAAFQSLDFAQQSGLTRQAIVLLSDGANDDPDGGPEPEEVLGKARDVGIPVFAVALGSGADTTFTELIAEASGGRAFVADDPSQLPGLYDAVAEQLNSEYIIRYQAPPGVGDQEITLDVETPGGRFSASSTFEVLFSTSGDEGGPQVALPSFEPGAMTVEQQTLSPNVEGAGISEVTVYVDGASQESFTEAPFSYELDAARFPPGRHALKFEAVDDQGRRARYEVIVEIPEAAPRLIVDGAEGTLRAGNQVTVEVLAQGKDAEYVKVTLNGEDYQLSGPPYVFAIPATLAEGRNDLVVSSEVDGEEISAEASFEFIPAAASASMMPFVLVAVGLLIIAVVGYLVYKRQRRRAAARPEEYTPGMRESYEPVAPAAAPAQLPSIHEEQARGATARLRAVEGPLRGKTFFLGNGSAVIGTTADATIQVALPGWKTAPELVRIWARDDKYMFHQVAAGLVTVGGREVQWAVLEGGDEIRIGEHLFVFEVPVSSPAYGGAAAQGAPAS